jgi:two-component system alkaline phosphatase synthesis response regulator PhoP/two-component system response regulator VicR
MRPRVLVVHGGDERFEAVCAALESRGLGVDEAEGPCALESLESRRPDVILLSLDCPAPNGMEILDRIRANPQHTGIPVILMGAQADDEDLLEGYKFGADYYLTQPFSTRHLLYALGLVLGREFPE